MLLLCKSCAIARGITPFEGESYEQCDGCREIKLVIEYVVSEDWGERIV